MRLLILSLLLFAFQGQTSAQEVLLSNLEGAVSIDASQNHLYVLEQGKHRFLQLDFDGNKIDSLGRIGSGDYQFERPMDIDVSNGLRIYVADTGNNRVQVFDRRLQYISTLKAKPDERPIEPTQLLINDFAEVLLYDKRSKDIKLFDEFGQERPRFNTPGEVQSVRDMKSDGNTLYVLDTKYGVVHRLETNGYYKSFYSADTIEAMTIGETGLIVSDWKGLRMADATDYKFSFKRQIVNDIVFVQGRGVYLLTDTQLIFYPY